LQELAILSGRNSCRLAGPDNLPLAFVNWYYSSMRFWLQAGRSIPDLPVYVDQSIKYTDFLSIVLTALAVVLAALAIAIGIAAIWGYNTIVEEAKRIATRAAETAVESKIRAYFEGQSFRDTLKEVVAPLAPAPPQAGGAGEGTVGKPYPEKGGTGQ
jgi:hypothetical protein